MKKVLTVFTLLALLLQAAPQLRSAADGTGIGWLWIDEEAPAEETKKVKDDHSDDKLSPHPVFDSISSAAVLNPYNNHRSQLPPSPYLQQHRPPPNAY